MSKRVYFVRHGESEANVARTHGGPQHPLSKKGQEQAQVIAERCTKLPLQALFASTMLRAQQTGQYIAERTQLPLQTLEGIEEVGMPTEAAERSIDDPEVQTVLEGMLDNMGPGYRYSDEESFDQMVERAGKTLEFFIAQKEEHIGVVSHGLFIRCILARAIFGSDINGREMAAIWRGLKSENTGLTILEYRPDTPKAPWRVFTWNDHAHLG